MESISTSPNLDCVAASAVARGSCFLEPAPAVAVMWEPMEFLVAHAGPACSPGCPECLRLEQVRQWLLRPFDSGEQQRTH
jgi:hypothetical protein